MFSLRMIIITINGHDSRALTLVYHTKYRYIFTVYDKCHCANMTFMPHLIGSAAAEARLARPQYRPRKTIIIYYTSIWYKNVHMCVIVTSKQAKQSFEMARFHLHVKRGIYNLILIKGLYHDYGRFCLVFVLFS